MASRLVAPFTGAWIETSLRATGGASVESHPSRVRGLKQADGRVRCGHIKVAPFTGAWIETTGGSTTTGSKLVAPFTGAWIETSPSTLHVAGGLSHPSRVRGLKQDTTKSTADTTSRTLHGCVD